MARREAPKPPTVDKRMPASCRAIVIPKGIAGIWPAAASRPSSSPAPGMTFFALPDSRQAAALHSTIIGEPPMHTNAILLCFPHPAAAVCKCSIRHNPRLFQPCVPIVPARLCPRAPSAWPSRRKEGWTPHSRQQVIECTLPLALRGARFARRWHAHGPNAPARKLKREYR